jgi:succinate dehydrogenase/fumarate reductase cytochrome b subunit
MNCIIILYLLCLLFHHCFGFRLTFLLYLKKQVSMKV